MNITDKRTYLAKIMSCSLISVDTYEITFKLEKSFEFIPGQYVWVRLITNKSNDLPGDRRSFSIANTPNKENLLKIIVRGGTSSYKKTLLSLTVGSEIEIIGPFGFSFATHKDNLTPLVMLAGGSGVVPFLSILADAKEQNILRPTTLIYSENSEDRFIKKPEIEEIDKLTLPISVKLLTKHIEWGDLKDVENLERSVFYVSGPQGFVDHVHILLSKNGIFEHNIRYESSYPTPLVPNDFGKVFENGTVILESTDVSEAKQKLLLLFQLIENSTNHIVITDVNGVIIFANKAAEKTTGYSFSEMRGNTPRLWGGLMDEEFYKDLWARKVSGEKVDSHVVNRRKNGNIYYVSAHITPLKNQNGDVIGFIGTEEDITELELERQKSQDNEERWRFAIEGAKDGVWDWDLETNKVIFSTQWKAMLGYADDEVKNDLSEWAVMVHPEDLKKTEDLINKHIAGETAFYQSEHRVKTKSGTYKWILDRGKIVRYSKDGKPLRMVGTQTDIDESKKYEQTLKELNERFHFATKAAKIGVWDWEVGSDKLLWDEIMYEVYGTTKETFSGNFAGWQKLVHPQDLKNIENDLRLAMEGSKEFDTKFRVIWPKDKSTHILKAKALVIRNEKGEPVRVTGVNFDTTKESLIDQEKTEFISLVSHQLKTPIGALSWNMESLLAGDQGALNEQQKATINEMYRMNMRMNELIKGLLNVSRIEMGVFVIEPVLTDFVSVCKEVLEEMTPRIKEKGHELKTDFGTNLPTIPADPKLLRIIFQNFISNAIKYTPPNGRVGVSINLTEGNIVVAVSNNGKPIPKEEQPNIFGRMYRTNDAKETEQDGNGLGLYLVKQIVENAPGKTWFTSNEGEDTVFYVSFPVTGMVKKAGSKSLT